MTPKRGQRFRYKHDGGISVVTAVRNGFVYVLGDFMFKSDGTRLGGADKWVADWSMADFAEHFEALK